MSFLSWVAVLVNVMLLIFTSSVVRDKLIIPVFLADSQIVESALQWLRHAPAAQRAQALTGSPRSLPQKVT